jgi:predicted alpha/beta-hydrolase family hydrolase
VQGTRDRLADLARLRPLCAALGASLHAVEGADHSFHRLRRSGLGDAEAVEEVAGAVAAWLGDPGA